MKRRLSGVLFIVVATGTMSVLAPGCKKNTGDNTAAVQLPPITTAVITAVAQTLAACGGEVTNDGNSAVACPGVYRGATDPQPAMVDSKTLNRTEKGAFTSS